MEDGTRLTAEMGNSISGADYAEAIQLNQHAGRLLGNFHQRYDCAAGTNPVAHTRAGWPHKRCTTG